MLAPSVRFYVDLLGSWAVFHVWSSNRCQGLWISLLFLFLTSLLNDGSPHMLCTQREFADFNSNSAAPSTFSLSGKATLSLQQCVKIVMEVFVTSAAPAPGKQMWLSIPWLQFSNESKKSLLIFSMSRLSSGKGRRDTSKVLGCLIRDWKSIDFYKVSVSVFFILSNRWEKIISNSSNLTYLLVLMNTVLFEYSCAY